MTPQERDALMPLLDRLRQARVGDKDAEADQLIRQTVQAQPDAPYLLAQTVLMQDYALHAAQDRIHALEQQVGQGQPQAQRATGGGGLLGHLFGGRPAAPEVVPAPGAYPGSASASPLANAGQPGAGQSSFLRSAAQTAAGIAGGALLFQGLEGLLGGHGGFGGGGGLFGGNAAGFLGGAAGLPGVGAREEIVENVNNYYDRPGPDDQGGFQGGDAADPSDYAADGGSDVSGADNFGGDSFGSDSFGGDDSYNS